MKDYDELVSRFDDIQDLPVSEEQIGAYLEGNLSLDEMEEMSDVLNLDPFLQLIVEEASMSLPDDSFDFDEDINVPLGNDITGEEAYVDNAYFSDEASHPDINIDASVMNIDPLDYSCDPLTDDSAFELPDLPFF